VEISLDLDMVSAACPGCRILLVEAAIPSLVDLTTAENLAAGTAGVVAVSNSWAGAEYGIDYQYASAFDHPGIAITVSSGDSGYQLHAGFPGTLPTVISVGGTELDPAPGTARGWSESAWNTVGQDGAAGGAWCSAWVERPVWQHQTVCSGRTSSDVSADADPYTGPSIYDSLPNNGTVYGWLRGGGTSAAAPFIAAVYALAGNTASIDDASRLYTHHGDLFDVTSGNDVAQDSCRQSLICNAVRGYDAVTGNGTPNGLAAF
jgi:subtilase family serine protease